jgi:hypothetical protein
LTLFVSTWFIPSMHACKSHHSPGHSNSSRKAAQLYLAMYHIFPNNASRSPAQQCLLHPTLTYRQVPLPLLPTGGPACHPQPPALSLLSLASMADGWTKPGRRPGATPSPTVKDAIKRHQRSAVTPSSLHHATSISACRNRRPPLMAVNRAPIPSTFLTTSPI